MTQVSVLRGTYLLTYLLTRLLYSLNSIRVNCPALTVNERAQSAAGPAIHRRESLNNVRRLPDTETENHGRLHDSADIPVYTNHHYHLAGGEEV